jgi:hypothetical protein
MASLLEALIVLTVWTVIALVAIAVALILLGRR